MIRISYQKYLLCDEGAWADLRAAVSITKLALEAGLVSGANLRTHRYTSGRRVDVLHVLYPTGQEQRQEFEDGILCSSRVLGQ